MLLINIIKGQDYTQTELERYLHVVRLHVGEEMDIKVEFVESIPLSKSGKRRFTISKIPVKFN